MNLFYALLILMFASHLEAAEMTTPNVQAYSSALLAAEDADPTWSVSSSDKTDTINAGAQQVCTYRVAVNAGKPAVKVIVRNSSGNQVSSTTVEGGNSADFDLAVGQSLHVEYINAASDGTYQKL